MENTEVCATLNRLAEICKDGEEGFRKAAEEVKDPQLAALFSGFSEERATFRGELREQVLLLGGDPDETGTVAGALHRGWIGLRTALAANDEAAVVSECERGEDAAVRAYQEALREPPPAEQSALVKQQFARIKEVHDRIRSLELGYKRRAT